jgi:hypothetical protein
VQAGIQLCLAAVAAYGSKWIAKVDKMPIVKKSGFLVYLFILAASEKDNHEK